MDVAAVLVSPVREKTLSLVSVSERWRPSGGAPRFPAVDALLVDFEGEDGGANSAKGDIVREEEGRGGEVRLKLGLLSGGRME